METSIGNWYLCEGYIEEPVRVEALEARRVLVRYLTTGRTRWLGYPRIWQACKPHALAGEIEFDARERVVVLSAETVGQEPLRLTLSQLRARQFPQLAKPRVAERRKTQKPAPAAAIPDPEWSGATGAWEDEAAIDADDEADLELDMSY